MSALPGPTLAIDTATGRPGVALLHQGSTRVCPVAWRGSFRETAPAVRAILQAAGLEIGDLAALAVPAGPGSFTGLRVGATLAVALARAGGTLLHAVPTLEAVAEAHAPPGVERVCAILDARRGRWYAALVDRDPGGWRTASGPLDLAPEDLRRFAGENPSVGAPETEAGPAPIADALARLVADGDGRYAVFDPGALRLIYARSATEG